MAVADTKATGERCYVGSASMKDFGFIGTNLNAGISWERIPNGVNWTITFSTDHCEGAGDSFIVTFEEVQAYAVQPNEKEQIKKMLITSGQPDGMRPRRVPWTRGILAPTHETHIAGHCVSHIAKDASKPLDAKDCMLASNDDLLLEVTIKFHQEFPQEEFIFSKFTEFGSLKLVCTDGSLNFSKAALISKSDVIERRFTSAVGSGLSPDNIFNVPTSCDVMMALLELTFTNRLLRNTIHGLNHAFGILQTAIFLNIRMPIDKVLHCATLFL